MDNRVPLIWTTHGNLPVSSLGYKTEWFENDNETRLVETYLLDEEVVKQNVHIKLKQGLSVFGEQAQFS